MTTPMSAEERAHKLTPRCTGGTGHGPGGDGPRWHSDKCVEFAEQIRQAEQAARADERRKVIAEAEKLVEWHCVMCKADDLGPGTCAYCGPAKRAIRALAKDSEAA